MNIYYLKNYIIVTYTITLLFLSLNVYALNCNNNISSNIIKEGISISEEKKISISPWPIIQLDTNCITQDKWNISYTIAYNENGDDLITRITSPYLSQASVIASKGIYSVEAGRYLNNFSYNSVFGIALPMKTIPAIQLDESSYLQTVTPDVLLVRINIKSEYLNVYLTGYRADKTFVKKSNVDNSYNLGASKQFFKKINIEFQYANEAVENSKISEKRTSFFANSSGSFNDGWTWNIGAEANNFINRNNINGNNDITANLYSEVSKKNIFTPGVNAYISAGCGLDKQNIFITEIGVFLNISRLFNMDKNILLLAGAAKSYSNFNNGDTITTERYSAQIRYNFSS